MSDEDDPASAAPGSRRQFLQQAAGVGLAGMAVPLLGGAAMSLPTSTVRSPARRAAARTPIEHIIICCQENHSFDHYFGTYTGVPPGFGIPPDFTQPNGQGGTVRPFHFTHQADDAGDPGHDWMSIHNEWNNGRMDGFYTTNGKTAMGYYQSADLPYYHSLFPQFALCANYFCGMLTETYPNRLVLYSGTSGGNTTNNIGKGSLDYPCILDLLSDHNITFRNYNFFCPANYSPLSLFRAWSAGGADNELNQPKAQFFADCLDNSLPGVSFITMPPPYDEHPPSDIRTGMNMIKSIVTAVRQSRAWSATAILIAYDQAGGFFDHIAPQQLDAYGPGLRVPMLIVSPHARPGYVDTTFSDHSSVLKFIEAVFGLPTLASINHAFDESTPTANNQANGAPFPPRDGNPDLSDLTQCFTFG
jgi:phospholipase C